MSLEGGSFEEGGSEFDVPPTPVRLGVVQRSNVICDLLIENEEEADNGSLSSLTGEVLQAQRSQTSELDGKRATLKELEGELQKCQKIHQSVFKDVKALNRQLYLIQDDVDEAKKHCGELESDILQILSDKRFVQSRLVHSKWNGKSHTMVFEKYREKIGAFKRKMNEYEEDTNTNQSIKRVNHELQEVKKKLTENALDSSNINEECEILETEVTQCTNVESCIDSEIKSIKQQTKKDEANISLLKKEIETLQKHDHDSSIKQLQQQIHDVDSQNAELKDQNMRLVSMLQKSK